jgi:hypothetical protein
VFPSRSEPFGLALLVLLTNEVLKAGFPAVAPWGVIGDAPVGVLNADCIWPA